MVLRTVIEMSLKFLNQRITTSTGIGTIDVILLGSGFPGITGIVDVFFDCSLIDAITIAHDTPHFLTFLTLVLLTAYTSDKSHF